MRSTLVAMSFSLAGVVVISNPGLFSGAAAPPVPRIGVLIALAAATVTGAAFCTVRALAVRREPPARTVLWFNAVSCVLCLGFAGGFVLPTAYEAACLLAQAAAMQGAQVGMARVMAVRGAGEGSLFTFLNVVWSVLLGQALGQPRPTAAAAAGCALIVAPLLAREALGRRG